MSLNRSGATVNAVRTTVASSGTTTPAFDISDVSFGGWQTPAALTSTSATYVTAMTEGGTYTTLKDSTGATITQTVAASGSYPLPPELFGFAWMKIVLGSAEAADRALSVYLKG